MMSRQSIYRLAGLVIVFGLVWGAPLRAEIEGGDKQQRAVEVEDVETAEGKTAKKREAADFGVEDFVEEKKFEGLKKQDEAIVRLRKLVDSTPKSNPERAEFLFNLAEMYWDKSKYFEQSAFRRQDRCYKYDDQGAKQKYKECMEDMDEALAESKRLRNQAIDYYRKIVSDYPEFKKLDKVYFFLGTNLMETDRQEEGFEVFQQLIAEFPNTKYVPDVLLAFGEYYFSQDEVRQALKAYKKVREYPESAVYNYARYKEAWCYFNLAMKPKAMQTFLEVIRYGRSHPSEQNSEALVERAQSDLVQTYAHIGQPDKAIGFFESDVVDDDRERLIELTEQLAVQYADNGKPPSSTQIYRRLLKINSESIEIIDYQYEIVQNELSETRYDDSTIEALVRLMKIFDKASPERFDDYSEEKIADKKKKVEKISRKWATIFHREAQETKNPKLYQMAAILYDNYLQAFPENKYTYKMTFYHGELQYELKNWQKAADAYDKTVAMQPEGKYTKDAVHGAVLAYFELVNTSEKSTDLQSKVAEETDGETKKKEIPDIKQGLARACQRYIEYHPEGDRIADVKYTLARTYYDANHFEKAIKWFRDIAYNHSDHDLATVSGNLHLDSLNLQDDIPGLHKASQNYLEKRPITDEAFLADVRELSKSIAFKRCNQYEDDEDWRKAAECFEQFRTDYPDSKLVDKALYNAALDYERVNELGKAIQARLKLLKSSPGTDLAAETLYKIGGNYHALAVYSKAAKYYEMFVDAFPRREKAKSALANASTFRQGLGQYDKAIKNYENYLNLYGDVDPKKTAEVSFQIATIYEKQDRDKRSVQQYKRYLQDHGEDGDLNRVLQAHVAIGMYYWGRPGPGNDSQALERFERTLKIYDESETDGKQQELKKARDAAARAKFMTAENVYKQVVDISIDSPNEEVLKKRLREKTDVAERAQKTYLEVLDYGRPGWAIAALYKIGALYENLANTIRNSPPPERLNERQTEMYKGILEDRAKKVEKKAVNAYERALKTAKDKSWFNEYSEKAEIRLARLRPEAYRKPSEQRAEPTYLDSGLERPSVAAEDTESSDTNRVERSNSNPSTKQANLAQ
jgi:tetratricopeptide (TPR) repeat protein